MNIIKQLIIALILKLKKRYPDKDELLTSLMLDFDDNYEQNIKWVQKTGVLDNKTEDLFNKLSPEYREKLFVDLFKTLYPKAVVNKNPNKNAYLFVIGDKKFFFDVDNNNVIMPMGEEEPRVFTGGEFFENMPKLEEFLKYLDNYSMRARRSFRFI